MTTLEKNYAVNPEYQAVFDELQKETIDFVRSNDNIIYSVEQTIERLKHLMVIAKLRSKTESLTTKYQANPPSTSMISALPGFMAKSSVVEDIERMIESYHQYSYIIDRINSKITKELGMLGTQDISHMHDMEWYRASLQFHQAEAAEFLVEINSLRVLSEAAIAQGGEMMPKSKCLSTMLLERERSIDTMLAEKEMTDEEIKGFIFLFCLVVILYYWFKAPSAASAVVVGS
ncbi:hypothetical protein MBANPS3_004033 [Mucor bainieri]